MQMNTEIALDAAGHTENTMPPVSRRLRRITARLTAAVIVLALLLAAWYVRENAPYTSDSDLAYYLGLVGGVLMLSLLLYPLRKRIRILNYLGALRHWFRFHMLAGVLGPLLVLFHSTFRVHSFNAAIAVGSMLLVVASGLVGRLLYRRIHRGLYGRRATLEELQQSLEQDLEAMRSSRGLPDDVKEEVERFARLVSSVPDGKYKRPMHFLSLGFRRRAAARRARRALTAYAQSRESMLDINTDLDGLLQNIAASLSTAQTTAQFATFERLFSYWHTVHIPFLFMLLVTALVHVFAVHAY